MSKTQIRRRLRWLFEQAGKVHFESYSRSRAGKDVKHRVILDRISLRLFCSCEHGTHRCAQHAPTVFGDPAHHCHHMTRAIRNCQAHGEIPKSPDEPLVIPATLVGKVSQLTGPHGAVIRRIVSDLLADGHHVVVSFKHAPHITSPFARELFGGLVKFLGREYVKGRVKVADATHEEAVLFKNASRV